MFTEPIMQRALLAALFLGPLCAFMGVFVTARRMAFFSDTISHAALTGVALGLAASILAVLYGNLKNSYYFHKENHHEGELIDADQHQQHADQPLGRAKPPQPAQGDDAGSDVQ